MNHEIVLLVEDNPDDANLTHAVRQTETSPVAVQKTSTHERKLIMKQPLHALIVEDSDDDCRLLVRELARSDYDVTHKRVETAVDLSLALVRETWDIIFCDYTLPRFGAGNALAIAKDTGLDLPFIYVSGTLGEETAVEAMKAGAHDYVMKDNLTRLLPAIARELREAECRRDYRRLEAERQQLIIQLQASLAEVKRLSGLLPICARCKNIRDEHAHWQPIETYIQHHSAATFTHGLCPDCFGTLYPELEKPHTAEH